MTVEQSRILSLLTAIESQASLTQRVLAKKLGVALGTAHELVHSLVARKMIELSQSGGRTIYRLTPLGVSEKHHLLNLQLDEAVDDYIGLRDRISATLNNLKKDQRRLVFYGTGDIAQIAYLVVASGDFNPVGVVDDKKAGQQFFGHKVAHPSELEGGKLKGAPFDVVIVASHTHGDQMKKNLRRLNLPPSQVFALFN